MHRIKQIRNQLGLTQWEMAGCLEIGRTVVNMIEKGKRYLNTPALLNLARLETFMNRSELPDQKVQKELPLRMPEGLDTNAEKDFQLHTLVLNKKIQEIDTGIQQAQNLEKVLKYLGEEHANKNLMNHLRLKAARKINRCSKEARKIISNRFLSFSNQCQAVRSHLQKTNCNVVL